MRSNETGTRSQRRPAYRALILGLVAFLALLPLSPLAAAPEPDGEHGSDAAAEQAAAPSCHSAGGVAPTSTVQAATEGLKVPDLEVLDQDGQPQHFYTDLVSGKVVAINFVFTTCTTVCPPMGATFSRLQRLLAEAGREDVALISVSIDPAVDTPARMKAWGRNFKAGDHWTLVTGAKPQIDRLLKGLGVFTADKSEHSPITILGNDRTGQWKRTNGLASPQKMVRQLMAMSEEPSAAPAADSVAGQ